MFELVRKDAVYPKIAWWEKCEFCPTFAYLETLVSQAKVVHPYMM